LRGIASLFMWQREGEKNNMKIAVASGKGGTGKTLIATSLALAIGENVQLLDCDVEEPNDHIFLKPKIIQTEKVSVLVPVINETKCDYCGKCADVCEFNAIVIAKQKSLIFPQLCHSCGGCVLLCPKKAIFEKEREVGKIEIGQAAGIELVTGILNVGEAKPIPLIAAVKKKIKKTKTVIIDASPGTSCPVVEAVKGSDYCILVTESTPFGWSDLKLAANVLARMKIPAGVVINKYDRSYTNVEDFCKQRKIPVLLRIPEERKIAEAYSKGKPLVKVFPKYKSQFRETFKRISQ